MKKLILTLVMGVFALNINANVFQTDCTQLAMDVHDAWTSQGFSNSYAGAQADAAYDRCVSHNGRPETEVIIPN